MAKIKIVPTNSEEINNQIRSRCKMNGTTLKGLGTKMYGEGHHTKLQNRVTHGSWTKNVIDEVNRETGLNISIKWGEVTGK